METDINSLQIFIVLYIGHNNQDDKFIFFCHSFHMILRYLYFYFTCVCVCVYKRINSIIRFNSISRVLFWKFSHFHWFSIHRNITTGKIYKLNNLFHFLVFHFIFLFPSILFYFFFLCRHRCRNVYKKETYDLTQIIINWICKCD